MPSEAVGGVGPEGLGWHKHQHWGLLVAPGMWGLLGGAGPRLPLGKGLWFEVPAWGAWLASSPQPCIHPPCSSPGFAHHQFQPKPLAKPFVPRAVPAATTAVQRQELSFARSVVNAGPQLPPSSCSQWRPCCCAVFAGGWWVAMPCAVYTPRHTGGHHSHCRLTSTPPPRGGTRPLLKHLCR